MASGGRKREFDEIMNEAQPNKRDDNDNDDGAPQQPSVGAQHQQELASVLASLNKLRLEAIFHPKFENENLNDRQIRTQMKERVANGTGYLEVTLKHSGSLLLWSGGQRYYSKNSTGNRFTDVGEILLRQHFVRAFWNERESTKTSTLTQLELEQGYQECSRFVEEQRLTLAFEVVTAVLGDHGATPKRDFMILTAVADRSTEKFYSTEELIALAQRFRLPHNDSWVCASAESVDELFSFYDSTRETGLATTVVKGLSDLSEVQVPSLYPHCDFQGEILEGIVIRYVSFQGRTDVISKVKELSTKAGELQTRVPCDLASCFELVLGLPDAPPSVLSSDVRKVFREARGHEEAGMDRFDAAVRDLYNDNGVRRGIGHLERPATRDAVQERMKELKESDDGETRRIAALVQSLDGLSNSRVNYSVVREEVPDPNGSRIRWICMIHVFFDKTFQKFRRQLKQGDMSLFRGFGVELCDDSRPCLNSRMQAILDTGAEMAVEEDGDTLMLKMKYLPYMVRTFGCRNGLRIIKNGGPSAFIKYTSDLLTKWQMSATARRKWQSFFLVWALYVEQPVTRDLQKRAPPTDGFYLDHLECLEELYAAGHYEEQVNFHHGRTFRGLAVVLSLDKEHAGRVADALAKELGGAQRITSLSEITPEDLINYREPGTGAVCSDATEGNFKKLRVLVGVDASSISLLLIGCAEDDIAKMNLPAKDAAELKGKLKGFKSLKKCPFVKDVSSSLFTHAPDETFAANEAFHEVVSEIRGVSNSLPAFDPRPGILTFFPGIPGCGKSSLLDDRTVKEVRAYIASLETEPSRTRKLVVQVGDKTKQKYWPLITLERLKHRSSIYIADKNVPSQTWKNVANIASSSRGVAVPVLPDSAALQSTTVSCFRRPNGEIVEKEHCYPFSLQYFAVCMARVLERPAGKHDGNLDRGTGRACFIVAKFMSLYRNFRADDFCDQMESTFKKADAVLAKPIRVPFFTEQGGSESLPSDLEGALIESLQVTYGFDLGKQDACKVKDEYVDALEKRLRTSLERHRESILGRTVEESVSRQSFISQLTERIVEVNAMESYTSLVSASAFFIKLASIDVNPQELHASLWRAVTATADERLSAFWEMVSADASTTDKTVQTNKGFVPNPHITMAHCKERSQADMRSAFGSLCGSRVQVKVTAVCWSTQVSALEVEIANVTDDEDDGAAVPRSTNAFSHMTLWCQEGVSGFASNALPGLVTKGEACRVELKDDAFMLDGTLSFWPQDKH